MTRLAVVVACLTAAVSLSGCKQHNAGQCDFYHSLGASYIQSQGYVPTSVQDEIDKYC